VGYSKRTRLAILAGSLLAAGGLAMAVPAQATTVACQNAYGDQCSTFDGINVQSPTPHAVFWDVRGGNATVNNIVIGFGADTAQDRATDFTKVLHIGTVPGLPASTTLTKSYSFVYTPNGTWTNLCVADTGTHVLTLRICNALQWQRFIAQQTAVSTAPTPVSPGFQGDRIRDNGNGAVPFALMNVAFSRYIADTSVASSFGPPAVPDTRQLATVGVVSFTANELWSWMS
jgi:hypothetical protein